MPNLGGAIWSGIKSNLPDIGTAIWTPLSNTLETALRGGAVSVWGATFGQVATVLFGSAERDRDLVQSDYTSFLRRPADAVPLLKERL